MPVAPPRPKGPHLNALRAFEAAARLGSFTLAAEELSVTPGAVTQHIKALEAWSEITLFHRNARGVVLTPLAEELLPEFTRAFDQLGLAVQALRTRAAPQKIRIATLPSIAQLWLAPRLGRLRAVSPDISVSVIAMEAPPNLDRDPYDMTLFFSGEPAGAGGVDILQDRIFPVCSAEIARDIHSVEDLLRHPQIHDSTWSADWQIWLGQHGEGIKSSGQNIVHSLFSVAMEEAKHGGGVLMAHGALVSAALDRGDLVRPLPQDVALPRHLIACASRQFVRSKNYQVLMDVFRHGTQ